MPALEVGRITNPGRRTRTGTTATRKKATKSKVLRELEKKNASMASNLKRLRKMNPSKPGLMNAGIHAAVAGAGGVVGSALAAAVTGSMEQGYTKGAVKIGMGLAASIAVEMFMPRSAVAMAAAYGACGALVDRGMDALGVYDQIGLNMDGSSYYMGADDYDDEFDYEVEDGDDVVVLDDRRGMGAISVQSGPLDVVSGTPGRSGLSARDTFRSVMSRV
jgi:hypothetical protein